MLRNSEASSSDNSSAPCCCTCKSCAIRSIVALLMCSLGAMKGPGSSASGGIFGSALRRSAYCCKSTTLLSQSFFICSFQASRNALAASRFFSCASFISEISCLRLRSTNPRARLVAFMPGVLPVPDNPTIAHQHVIGSDQVGFGRTRRLVPIKLDVIPISGIATCDGVTPAPWAARSTHVRQATDTESSGKSGNGPRLSSMIE
jgi:hypothetical protein